jgi:hypothetical protein
LKALIPLDCYRNLEKILIDLLLVHDTYIGKRSA